MDFQSLHHHVPHQLSTMMRLSQGYSYGSDEGPVMCFNGPNMYQLGWYSAYYVNLPVVNNFDWTGDLVGIAEKVVLHQPPIK
jgi:hypothetical protein